VPGSLLELALKILLLRNRLLRTVLQKGLVLANLTRSDRCC
jgi:hypothetical protein